MTNQLLKTILAGIIAGIALFILPFFLLRIALFFLLIGAAFRLMRGRYGYGCGGYYRDRYPMNDAERAAWFEKYGATCRVPNGETPAGTQEKNNQ